MNEQFNDGFSCFLMMVAIAFHSDEPKNQRTLSFHTL